MSIDFYYRGSVCVSGNEETGAVPDLIRKAEEQAIARTCGTGEVDSYHLVESVLSSEKGNLCMGFTAHIVCRNIKDPIKDGGVAPGNEKL